MGNVLWDKWADCHDDADQKKRQASAKKTACTPTLVDFIEQTGTFVGSSGHHTTALDHCTCVDFNRRRLPCKHMYRLAMELGLMDGDYQSNTDDIVKPIHTRLKFPECVAIIESLSVDAQILLKKLLYNMNSKDIYRCAVRSAELNELLSSGMLVEASAPKMQLAYYKFNDLKKQLAQLGHPVTIRKKEELIDWIIDNVSDCIPEICSDTIIVRVPEDIKYRKMYIYLLRKYDLDYYYDENMEEHAIPHGAVTSLAVEIGINGASSSLTLQFPEDDITEQLNKYHANRCDNWII